MRYFVLIPTLLFSACAAHKSDLDETFEWMDNTYNPHENVSGAYGHGRTAWYTKSDSGRGPDRKVWGSKFTFTRDGCSMAVTDEPDTDAETSDTMRTISVSAFRLQDIDPASVHVTPKTRYGDLPCENNTEMNCDHAALHMKTKNEAGLIEEKRHTIYPQLTGKDHDSNDTLKTNSFYMEIDDPEYAQRFAKAFVHAVELCGGKPSKF